MSTRSPTSTMHPSQTTSPAQSTSTLPSTRNGPTRALSSAYPYSRDSFSIGNGQPSRRPIPFDPSHSMRKISSVAPSASGTSTPDYKRRARRMVERGINETEAERDWGNVEPDDVFRRLPVGEVRKVEARMRTEALGKQAELRSMVGTRYRDLLTSATQITSLHASSARLSQQLKQVSQKSVSEVAIETSSVASDDDLGLLPAAAHMKLLLDATEALYVYLGNKEYLAAAYLWLVARVAKESLGRMEEGSVYIPLMQKQWETLLPFRGQIVQQATELLKTRQLSCQTLTETILSIILLDNLAVPDALALYLSQRKRTIQEILAHPSSTETDKTRRRRTNSRLQGREAIGRVLSDAVQSLETTLTTAKEIFEQQGESAIERLIRLVQLNEPPITAPLRRTSSASHHRRASRLVSISLPIRTNDEAPISATRVIQSLPSFQILIRHLPPAVLAYTPFITPPQSPRLEQLDEWKIAATDILKNAAPSWLADLQSVTAVWQVREMVAGPLEDAWSDRVRDIWRGNFTDIVQVIRILAADITDDNPGKFIFSDLAFPSLTTTLATPHTSVPSFIATLKKRGAYRTPKLDEVLTDLESRAKRIKDDREALPGGLVGDYRQIAEEGMARLVQALKERESELFIGRVALFLAAKSTFLADLEVDAVSDLTDIHVSSTTAWRENAVTQALSQLDVLFDPLRTTSRATWQAALPLGPSAGVMHAMHSLVKATKELGLPMDVKSGVVQRLVEDFARRVGAMDGWKEMQGERCVQGAVDLGFVLLVAGDGEGVGNDIVEELVKKSPEQFREKLSNSLHRITHDSLRRTQLLLSPIIAHLPASALGEREEAGVNGARTGGGTGNWLRFGPPSTRALFPTEVEAEDDDGEAGAEKDGEGNGQKQVQKHIQRPALPSSTSAGIEFRSPLAVAKPGKRFTLLSTAD